MKTIPYLDLISQYKPLKNEILNNIYHLYNSCSFVSGELVEELENKLADYNGAKYCVCVNNGTSALDLAIKTFNGTKYNEAAITQANSFFATYEALFYNFYEVEFVDVNNTCGMDFNNYNFAPNDLLVPVSLYGNPPKLDKKHKKQTIIDNAQGIGCQINGENLMNYCDTMTLSFYPGKNLGSNGEGGAILVNHKSQYEWLKQMRNHGQKIKGKHDLTGYNYRMSEINACHLNVCIKYLDEWTEKRINIAKRYEQNFALDIRIKTMKVLNNNKCVYHIFPVFVENRDKVRAKLLKCGVETAIHYPIPIHKQKPLKSAYMDLNLPNTQWQARHEISLPCYPTLSFDSVDQICEKLIKCL